jgi:hypothetical protein
MVDARRIVGATQIAMVNSLLVMIVVMQKWTGQLQA